MIEQATGQIALIVPSNREESFLDFLKRWWVDPHKDFIDQIFLVWDGHDAPVKIVKAAENMPIQILTWKGMPDYFSRKDSAIRSYGFLEAYRQGYQYFVTMDDDCYPWLGQDNVSSIRRHVETISAGVPAFKSTVDGHIRGLPYTSSPKRIPVYVNVGLWQGVPDVDSIHALTNITPRSLSTGHTLVHPRERIPMCGMNLAFTREVVPLMYFPPMGLGQPYARFDDIWCGLFVQTVMHHLGLAMAYGEPYVFHSRASDPFINLLKEAPGIPVNEELWKTLYSQYLVSDPTKSQVVANTYVSLIKGVKDLSCFPREYKTHLVSGMTEWINNFLPVRVTV